jgi:hypothetical protein
MMASSWKALSGFCSVRLRIPDEALKFFDEPLTLDGDTAIDQSGVDRFQQFGPTAPAGFNTRGHVVAASPVG